MSKQSYGSSRRPGTFRRKIPTALVAVFGCEEITKSVRRLPGASDETKCRLLAAATDDLFARALQEAVPGQLSLPFVDELRLILNQGKAPNHIRETLAVHHVEPLLARYRAAILATEGEELAGMDPAAVSARDVELVDAEAQLRAATVSGNVAAVDATARMLLSAEGLDAVRVAPEYQALLAQLLRTDLQVLLEQRARLRGDPCLPVVVPAPVRDAPRLADLIPDWIETNSPHVNTVKSVRSIVREFETQCGTLPAAAITRQQAVDFGKSLKKRNQARKTIQKKVHLLGALFGPAIEEAKYGITTNPFSRLKVAKKTGKKKGGRRPRRALRNDELQAIFDSPVYREGKRPLGGDGEAMFWIPLIATFTGARLEEIAQLRVCDIERVNGVWTLHFVDDGDLQLKTASSYRSVPIHSELLRCGLLQYLRAIKRAGHARLFPLMEKGNNGKFSDNFSKAFNRYLDHVVGIADPCVCFHSFRWTFKQRCVLCGIEAAERDALAGHVWDGKSAGRGYEADENGQYPFPKLVDAIAELRFDELDLTHLHTCDDKGDLLPAQPKDIGGQS